ncbi:hypothetical protein BJX96DRAFT_86252 [Aspergillus floccosus]
MATATLFDYLRDDPTVINSLVDLSTPPAPVSETEWLPLSNEDDNQVMHKRNAAVEDPDKTPTSATPMPLSTAMKDPVSTLILDYCNFLTAYPKTHPEGYSYVINTQAAHPLLVKNPITSVQYSNHLFGGKRQMYCTFLSTRVEKIHYRCSGVKACEFLHEDLKSLHHTEVSDQMFTKMAYLRTTLADSRASPQDRATYSFFREIQSKFSRGTACSAPQESCSPVFKRLDHNAMSGNSPSLVLCSNATAETVPNHFRQNLAGQEFRVDFDLLEQLFATPNVQKYDRCAVMEPTTSRRPN